MDDNNITNLPPINFDELSVYDTSYPIRLLSYGMETNQLTAQNFVHDIYQSIIKQSPIAMQVAQSTKKGFRLVVDAGDSMLSAIEQGKVKLSIEKSGKMVAQIRQANGQYGVKLPIKKEFFKKGIDPTQMANALQMQALQEQLVDIADQLNIINESVVRVIEGLQNDRIAQYYAGLALYAESRYISDDELKKSLIAQSLKLLTQSTFELTLTMNSAIKRLKSSERKELKGRRVENIDECMKEINQCFAFIHQSAMLRAGIYCIQNELPAMASVLKEYTSLIEDTIGTNASLLSQCDTRDDGTAEGIWQSRAKLKLNAADFAKQLNCGEKVLYLDVTEEVSNEGN